MLTSLVLNSALAQSLLRVRYDLRVRSTFSYSTLEAALLIN